MAMDIALHRYVFGQNERPINEYFNLSPENEVKEDDYKISEGKIFAILNPSSHAICTRALIGQTVLTGIVHSKNQKIIDAFFKEMRKRIGDEKLKIYLIANEKHDISIPSNDTTIFMKRFDGGKLSYTYQGETYKGFFFKKYVWVDEKIHLATSFKPDQGP